MSTTNVHALHDAAGHGEYIELGRDEKRAGHITAGTNRLAAMRSSLGSVSEFARHARMTARRFARTVEAQLVPPAELKADYRASQPVEHY